MDSTTFVLLIVAVLVVAAGIGLWARSRSAGEFGGGAMAVPPPASIPSPKPLPVDVGGSAGVEAEDENSLGPIRTGENLFPSQEEAKPGAEVPPPPPLPTTEAEQPIPQPAPSGAIPDPVGGAAEPEPAIPAEEISDLLDDLDEQPDMASPDASNLPAIPTADVRFTAFYPKEIAVETWYTLLAYAHIESVLAKVQDDAGRFKAEMGGVPRESRSGAPAKLTRGVEITIEPHIEGVSFNPEQITFKWIEDMHRTEFRFIASKNLAGSAVNGLVSIFVGPLLVATIKVGMLFEESMALPPVNLAGNEQITAVMYKQEQIFVSYSHTDTSVVLACRNAYQALGYDVLIDVDDLRAGQQWNQTLMQMIDRADIFQLFWSERAAQSVYVKQEWEHALKKSKTKGAESFIRPVYWEKPMPTPPPELSALHFAYMPLPSLTNTQDVPHH